MYSRPMDPQAAHLGGPVDDARMGEGREVIVRVDDCSITPSWRLETYVGVEMETFD